MDITEFTTFLVKSLVKESDMVKVSSFLGDEETTIVEVLVANSDMPALIGYQGRNAKALRTIINAYSYVNGLKKVKINIDSF